MRTLLPLKVMRAILAVTSGSTPEAAEFIDTYFEGFPDDAVDPRITCPVLLVGGDERVDYAIDHIDDVQRSVVGRQIDHVAAHQHVAARARGRRRGHEGVAVGEPAGWEDVGVVEHVERLDQSAAERVRQMDALHLATGELPWFVFQAMTQANQIQQFLCLALGFASIAKVR